MVPIASVISGYLFWGLSLFHKAPAHSFSLTRRAFICGAPFFFNFNKNIFLFLPCGVFGYFSFCKSFYAVQLQKIFRVRHAAYISGGSWAGLYVSQFSSTGGIGRFGQRGELYMKFGDWFFFQ